MSLHMVGSRPRVVLSFSSPESTMEAMCSKYNWTISARPSHAPPMPNKHVLVISGLTRHSVSMVFL